MSGLSDVNGDTVEEREWTEEAIGPRECSTVDEEGVGDNRRRGGRDESFSQVDILLDLSRCEVPRTQEDEGGSLAALGELQDFTLLTQVVTARQEVLVGE